MCKYTFTNIHTYVYKYINVYIHVSASIAMTLRCVVTQFYLNEHETKLIT